MISNGCPSRSLRIRGSQVRVLPGAPNRTNGHIIQGIPLSHTLKSFLDIPSAFHIIKVGLSTLTPCPFPRYVLISFSSSSLYRRACLMKVPFWYSRNASFNSSWVFMTIGPYQATGSPMGLPEISRKRTPSFSAVTKTSSPSP